MLNPDDDYTQPYLDRVGDRMIRETERSLVDAGHLPPPPDPFQQWAESPKGQETVAHLDAFRSAFQPVSVEVTATDQAGSPTAAEITPDMTAPTPEAPAQEGAPPPAPVSFADLDHLPGHRLEKLDQKLAGSLSAMAAEFRSQTGRNLRVSDGFRTREQQADAYRRKPGLAAPPGRSMHEYGHAVDIHPEDAEVLISSGLGQKHGLDYLKGQTKTEKWHWQLADSYGRQDEIRAGAQAAGYGPQAAPNALDNAKVAPYKPGPFTAVLDMIGEVGERGLGYFHEASAQSAEMLGHTAGGLAKAPVRYVGNLAESLDSIAGMVADMTGGQKTGVFKALKDATDEYVSLIGRVVDDATADAAGQSRSFVEYPDFLTSVVGSLISAPGGITLFAQGPALAGLTGYGQGGLSEAAMSTAKWFTMDAILKAGNSFSMIPRTFWNAAAMGGETAVMGGDAKEVAKGAALGAAFGVLMPGHRQPKVRGIGAVEFGRAFDDNVNALWRSFDEGSSSLRTLAVGESIIAKARDMGVPLNERVALEIIPEIKIATDEALAKIGGDAKAGVVLGSHTPGLFKSAVRLYLDPLTGRTDAQALVHELGHEFMGANLERVPPKVRDQLTKEWDAAGRPGELTEYAADRFADTWVESWEKGHKPKTAYDKAAAAVGAAMDGFVARIGGLPGANGPKGLAEAVMVGRDPEVATDFQESFQAAAMYRSPKADIETFVREVVGGKQKKKAYYELEERFPTMPDVVVQVPSDTVIHDTKRHPDIQPTDWAKLPELIPKMKDVAAHVAPQPVYNGTPFVGKIHSPEASYGLIGEAMTNGRVLVTTFFKDNQNTVENWYRQNALIEGAAQAPGGTPRLPKPALEDGSRSWDDSSKKITPPEGEGNPQLKVKPVSRSRNWEEIGQWGFGDAETPFEVREKLDPIREDILENNLPAPLKAKGLGINYSKLDSVEAIDGLINRVETALFNDIDAARRFERSHDTTRQAAEDLGMTEAGLLDRMRGEGWNAEKIYAARMVLNSSAEDLMQRARAIKDGNNSDEAMAAFRLRLETHAAIQAQVAGLRAEAGRALNQFKMLSSSAMIDPQLMGQGTAGDMRNVVIESGGSRAIMHVVDTLLTAQEAGTLNPGKVSNIVKTAHERTFGDWIIAYRYAAMLSSFKTHAANVMGNFLTAGLAIPERYVASVIGKGLEKVQNTTGLSWDWLSNGTDGRVDGLEAKAMAFALVQNQADAFKLAWAAAKTGDSQFGGGKMDFAPQFKGGGKATSAANKAADLLWDGLNVTGRMLGAEDEYFKFLNYRMEIAARSYRQAAIEGHKGRDLTARAKELMDSPNEDTAKAALDAAKTRTFTNDLGPFMQKIQGLASANMMTKLLMPFVRTPWNILQYSLDRTPVAFIKKSFWGNVQSGGAKRDLALSQVALGTSISGLALLAASSGLITGDGPSDPNERSVWRRLYQPNSIKVGDSWYSYSRLEPIGMLFSAAANARMIYQEWDDLGIDMNIADLMTAMALAAAKTVTSKTWLTGVSDALNAITFPEARGPRLLQGLASSFVPALLRDVQVELDPEVKAVYSWVDAMASRIPGVATDLPSKRDIWGDPYIIHAAGEGIWLRWLSPIKVQKQETSPIDEELLRMEYSPQMPRRTQSIQGVEIELTPHEFDRMVELSTKVLRHPDSNLTMEAHLNRMIQTPQYRAMDDDRRQVAIADHLRVMRHAAQLRLVKENPRLQAVIGLAKRNNGRATQ